MRNKNILSKSRFCFLSENKSIFEAIKKLQLSKIKTLIITNKKNKLIGTITDGDIRRGILKGYTTLSFMWLIKNLIKKS